MGTVFTCYHIRIEFVVTKTTVKHRRYKMSNPMIESERHTLTGHNERSNSVIRSVQCANCIDAVLLSLSLNIQLRTSDHIALYPTFSIHSLI